MTTKEVKSRVSDKGTSVPGILVSVVIIASFYVNRAFPGMVPDSMVEEFIALTGALGALIGGLWSKSK